jgi:hypothetical protein
MNRARSAMGGISSDMFCATGRCNACHLICKAGPLEIVLRQISAKLGAWIMQSGARVMNTITARQGELFELRFQSLFVEGRAWAFPCNAQGYVDLDHMSDRARNNYFFARSVIGREVTLPRVYVVA